MTQLQLHVKCRLCRLFLLSGEAIVNAHGDTVQGDGNLAVCGDADSLALTQLFLSEDCVPRWLANTIAESLYTQGKITCPKCQGRLGSFDFLKTKHRCHCGKTVLPPIHLLRDRVDLVHLNQKIRITTPVTRSLKVEKLIKSAGKTPEKDGSLSPAKLVLSDYSCRMQEFASSDYNCKTLGPVLLNSNCETLQPGSVDHSRGNADGCLTGAAERYDSLSLLDASVEEGEVRGGTQNDSRTDLCDRDVKFQTAGAGAVSCENLDPASKRRQAASQREGVSKRDRRRLRKQEDDEFVEAFAEENTFEVLRRLLWEDFKAREPGTPERRKEVAPAARARLSFYAGGNVSHQRRNLREIIRGEASVQQEEALPKDGFQLRKREVSVGPLEDVPLEMSCAMCLEVMLNPHTTLPCRHDFCATCLRRLALSTPVRTKCPLCRETIAKCIPNAALSRMLQQQYPGQLAQKRQQEKKVYPRNSPLPSCADPAGYLSGFRHRRLLPGRLGPSRRKLAFMLLNVAVVAGISCFGMTLCRHVLGCVAEVFDAVLEKLTGEKLWSEFMGLESRILTVSSVFVLYLVCACMVKFLRIFQQIENA